MTLPNIPSNFSLIYQLCQKFKLKKKCLRSRIAMYLLNKKEDPDVEDEREFLEKMPEPEADIENENIYIRRTFLQNYFLSEPKELGTSNETIRKKSLSEEEKNQRQEKLKQMETVRKKALKAALKRAKQKRLSALDEENGEDTVSIII